MLGTTRALVLRSETLTALSDGDLADVVGAAITGPSCFVVSCVQTSPARCYWATFDTC